jgi:hypothetical protein
MIELVGFGPSFVSARHRPGATSGLQEKPAESGDTRAASRPEDEIDQIELRSSFRSAKIVAVREAIDAGTYETHERIAGTVSRLIDVIA